MKIIIDNNVIEINPTALDYVQAENGILDIYNYNASPYTFMYHTIELPKNIPGFFEVQEASGNNRKILLNINRLDMYFINGSNVNWCFGTNGITTNISDSSEMIDAATQRFNRELVKQKLEADE